MLIYIRDKKPDWRIRKQRALHRFYELYLEDFFPSAEPPHDILIYAPATYITHFTKQGSFSKRWGTWTLLTCTQGCGEKKNHGVSTLSQKLGLDYAHWNLCHKRKALWNVGFRSACSVQMGGEKCQLEKHPCLTSVMVRCIWEATPAMRA